MSVTQADRDFARLLFLISEIERQHADTAFTIGVVSKEVFDNNEPLLPTDSLVGIAMVAESLHLECSPEIANFGKIRAALPQIKKFVISLPTYVEEFIDGQLHFCGRRSRYPLELSAHEKMEILQNVRKICGTLV